MHYRQLLQSYIRIVLNFEHISHLVLPNVSIVNFEQVNAGWKDDNKTPFVPMYPFIPMFSSILQPNFRF